MRFNMYWDVTSVVAKGELTLLIDNMDETTPV